MDYPSCWGSTKQACPWRVSLNWGRWQGQLWHHMSHVRREGCRCLLTGGRICSTLAREMWRGCSAKMHIGRVGVCRLAGLFWVWESHRSCLSSALWLPPLRRRWLSDQSWCGGRGARGQASVGEQESHCHISHLCGTSGVCVLSLRGAWRIMEEKLKEGLVECTFIN